MATQKRPAKKRSTKKPPAKPVAKSARAASADRPSLTAMLERAAAGNQPLIEVFAAWELVPAAEIAAAIETVVLDELAEVTTFDAVAGLARLTRLDKRRDPRMSAAFVAWLADPPWHATGSQPFYRALFERLEHVGDPRAIPGLAKATRAVEKLVKGKSMRTWLVDRIGRSRDAIAARWPDGVPALTAPELALVKRVAKAIASDRHAVIAPKASARTQVGSELLAAIRADPSDDGARQVYADVLAEKGDPRGEFITMQLARAGREPDPRERGAELRILGVHVRVWLGELANVVGRVTQYNLRVGPERTGSRIRFERGFLAGCRISASPAKLRTVIGNDDLATVEELSIFDGAEIVLQQTRLPALRSLDLDCNLIDGVLAAPCVAKVESIGLRGQLDSGYLRAVEACVKLPALRELRLYISRQRLGDIGTAVVQAALASPSLRWIEVAQYGTETTFERTEGGPWSVSSTSEGTDRVAALAALI